MMFIMPNEIETYKKDNEKDYVIDFKDGSKGIIKIDDSGSWLIDTPFVLLLLLWIFIDNCKTSAQRVCAKLEIVDCMLIHFSESSIDNLTQEDDEIKRLGREHSRYFAYQNRVGQFSIKASKVYQRLAILELVIFSGSMSSITLNSESAMNFMNGKSDDYCDSMIYQLSEKIIKYPPDRFRRIIWRIDFKGSDAVDLTGVTNQTITMAINSFLFLKTGLCIISPNFTENTPNSVIVNPNFSIVPDYLITVKFDDDMVVTGFPLAHTCFNEINIPTYPTLEIMREKLNVAIECCEGMDIKYN